MKINGRELYKLQAHEIFIPRGNDDPIIFQARPVVDWEEFDKKCPEPKAPLRMKPGGRTESNLQDDGYKSDLEVYSRRRMAWLILESLAATECLEWSTVDRANPETWLNYEEELAANFSAAEVNRIVRGVMIANGLDERYIEEARKSFQRMQAAVAADISGPSTAQNSI